MVAPAQEPQLIGQQTSLLRIPATPAVQVGSVYVGQHDDEPGGVKGPEEERGKKKDGGRRKGDEAQRPRACFELWLVGVVQQHRYTPVHE